MTQPTLELYGDQRPTLHRPRVAAAALIVAAVQALLNLAANVFHIYSSYTHFYVGHRMASLWTFTAAGFTSEFLGSIVFLLFAVANVGKAAGNPLPLILYVAAGLLDEITAFAARAAYVMLFNPASRFGLTFTQERIFGLIDLVLCAISILALFAAMFYAAQIARFIRRPALFSATAIVAGICLLVTMADIGVVLYRLIASAGFDMTAFGALYSSAYTGLTYARALLCILLLNYSAILAVRLLAPRNR